MKTNRLPSIAIVVMAASLEKIFFMFIPKT